MTGLVPSPSSKTFLETATRRYAGALPGSPADEYLIQERGLTRAIIDRFHLGFVADPMTGHDPYGGCLAIPYLTPAGVTSIRFRRLAGDGPKYLTVSGDMARLYNTAALVPPHPVICVCEGEIDAITATMAGLAAIGVPGAKSWNPVWSLPLRQYDAVYVLVDDDKAGHQFGKTIGEQLDTARIVPMNGGDVNSFVKEHGIDALKRRIHE